jgi:hypothetical protein
MDALNRLKAEVFAKQKTLAKIYKEFGEQSLFDYAQGWKVSLVSKNTRAFFDSAGSLLQKVYPESVVNEALIQTGQMPLVSTIDHHGILNHPFFVNSNLIFGQRRGLKYLLCLSTAGVSLNNSSWPGCLLLSRPDGQTERLSFFPDRLKTRAVLTANNFSKEDSARVENQRPWIFYRLTADSVCLVLYRRYSIPQNFLILKILPRRLRMFPVRFGKKFSPMRLNYYICLWRV